MSWLFETLPSTRPHHPNAPKTIFHKISEQVHFDELIWFHSESKNGLDGPNRMAKKFPNAQLSQTQPVRSNQETKRDQQTVEN